MPSVIQTRERRSSRRAGRSWGLDDLLHQLVREQLSKLSERKVTPVFKVSMLRHKTDKFHVWFFRPSIDKFDGENLDLAHTIAVGCNDEPRKRALALGLIAQ